MKKKTLIGLLTLVMLSVLTAFCFTACTTRVQNVHLNFVVEGETISTIETSGKEVVSIPNNPEKEGYTFDGWYWDKDVWANVFTANSLLNAPISSDMSVYAKMTPIQYSITYSLDGGSNTNPSSYNIETPTLVLSDAVKIGYTFNGWYKESSFTNKVTSIEQGSMGDIELYAKFTINQYTISFNADGGSDVDSITQDYNTVVSAPTAPTKNGYTFDGWFENGSQTAYTFSTIPAENVSLNAKWTPIEYTINYDLNGGINDDNPIKYTIETETITLKDATKGGYDFDGWFIGTEKVDQIELGSTGNVELTAHWTLIEYTIAYENTKSVTNSNPVKYTIESNTITLENLEKLGYTFNGWYNGAEKVTSIEKGSTGNITLTADWTVNGYEITYYNIDGATNTNPDVYDVEDEPLTLLDASKAGYTFIGWYTDSEFKNEIETITVGTIGDKDLYAKWEIIEYTASFKADNNIVEDVIFTVKTESLIEPTVPNKNGYNGEWESYVIIASDITVNAVYTPITYSITYNNTKERPNSNPIGYNVEDNTIILKNLEATGYVFDGWFNGEEQITEIVSGTFGNIVLTAKWTAIEYSINYIYDDTKGDLPNGVAFKVKYTIEDDFDFVILESKTIGYSFAGWYTEKIVGTGTKVDGVNLGTTGDITVYGQWGAEVYTITYHNVEGVTNTNATTYTIESEDFTITNLSKEGYTFEGWYSDNEFSNIATTTIVKGSHGDIDLYAKWEKITYTLTYNLYGGSYASGSNPANYTIEDDIALINPAQAGKFFVGWYSLAENGDLVKQISAGTTGNITLYARWLAFDSNGGSTISYTPDFSESGLTKPTDPTKNYYEFAGWYFDEQLTQKYDFKRLPSASSTLYAKWDAVKYTITYILYDGTNSATNPATYTVEDNVTFSDPSKTGYTFNGWYSNSQFTSALVTGIPVGSHENITIYANFGINQYTISFNSNGGTSVDDITQNYATSISAPANPAKNGYSFDGWYSDSTLKNGYMFTTIPAENITLYAKWNLVTYNITYNLDGGTNSASNSATYTIESATHNLADPAKTGYTFVGWYTDSSYNNPIEKIDNGSYGNKELFAKWQINTYSITYSIPADAENSNLTEYTVITPSTTLVDASMTGYTFNGWFSNSSYTQTVTAVGGGSIGDITIYGKFTANKYNIWLDGNEQASCAVSFNLNGANGTAPATQNITETNTLVYPAIPTRNGYIFGGWYSNSECSGDPYDFSALVATDIVLYAKWVSIGNDNVININSTETVQLSGTAEKIYKFVPLVSGNVSITSTGSIDTLGSLYKGSTRLKMDDDSGVDSNFLIVYNVTAGEVYEIHVRGFSSSTNGSINLSLTGVATIAQGGYSKAGNKSEATFGESFKLPIPEAEGNYKFLGWQDSYGVMYTDGQGNSIINWNKAENSVLYSKWEKMEYTVTFITNGGSAIETVTLEYGARLDLNKYITSRSNYSFVGWYLNASDTEAYSAGTMPDHNLVLYAKWTSFALGTIKFDDAKKAISIYDTVNAELFKAICLDTDGNLATFTVSISGTQLSGETITIRLTATSGTKNKQVTISDVKVYGEPSLVVSNTEIDYVNINGDLTAEWFGAVGTDTFGDATDIVVSIVDNRKEGEIADILIEAIDVAGNVFSQTVNNIKLYGKPIINYTNISDLSYSYNGTTDVFNATATDSFGETLALTTFITNKMYVNNIYSFTSSDYYMQDLEALFFDVSSNDSYILNHGKCNNSGTSWVTSFYIYNVSDGVLVKSVGNSGLTNSTLKFDVTGGKTYCLLIDDSNRLNYASSYVTLSLSDSANNPINWYRLGSSASTSFSGKTTTSGENSVYFTAARTARYFVNASVSKSTVMSIYDCTANTSAYSNSSFSSDLNNIGFPVVAGHTYRISTRAYGGESTNVGTFSISITNGNDKIKMYKDIYPFVDKVSIYTKSTSSEYVYFLALKDEEYTFSCRNNTTGGSSTIYASFTLYNTTTKQSVTSFNSLTSKSGEKTYTFTAKAGNIYRIGVSTTQSGTSCVVYVKKADDSYVLCYNAYPALMPLEPGQSVSATLLAIDSKGNSNIIKVEDINIYGMPYLSEATCTDFKVNEEVTADKLGIFAYDTYGKNIDVSVELIGGEKKAGQVATYLVSAEDCVGNIITKEIQISFYGAIDVTYGKDGATENVKTADDLSICAKDSFGVSLNVEITLYSGRLIAGQIVTFTIRAVDIVGNVYETNKTYKVYSSNDINLTYNSWSTDKIKISSNGEEFDAIATDTFGQKCDISIEVAEGYELKGGETISLYIIATDKAGNSVRSEKINNIKVYDLPQVTYNFTDRTISVDTDITFLFTVADSFGEELYAEITTADIMTVGSVVEIHLNAEDEAGNSISQIYSFTVIENNQKPNVISQGDFKAELQLDGTYKLVEYSGTSDYVQIPNYLVSTIGATAFQNNAAVKEIVIGEGILSIEAEAFKNCTGLIKLVIPNTVTSIGLGALSGCSSLKELQIPFVGGSVKKENELEQYPFGYIFGSTSYNGGVSTSQSYYLTSTSSTSSSKYYIPNTLTKVIVTGGNILYGAFSNCSYISEIVLPNSLSSIGSYAFYGCGSLLKIEIPQSVLKIGRYAFNNVVSIIYCEAKSKPSNWDSNWYYSCHIIWDCHNNSTSTSGYEFVIKDGIIYGIKDGDAHVMKQAKKITRAIIPEKIKYKNYEYAVKSLGDYAFKSCDSLEKVFLPNTLDKIGNQAFSNCSKLVNISIPASVTSIGDQAFYSCTSLTKVIINEGVKSIGSGAFYNCNALTYIYIPSTVTSIGQGALEKCKSLIEITIPFVGGSIKTSADTDQNPLGYLFGTDSGGGVATVQYYYASSTSSSTSKTYYIPMSLKKVTVLGGNILYGAFYNCATIENIILSEGVMSIATSAFKGCSSLSSIIIPNSVTSIGPSAFTDCNNLTIYCEIENKPSGWNNNWNNVNRPVIWDYKNN